MEEPGKYLLIFLQCATPGEQSPRHEGVLRNTRTGWKLFELNNNRRRSSGGEGLVLSGL